MNSVLSWFRENQTVRILRKVNHEKKELADLRWVGGLAPGRHQKSVPSGFVFWGVSCEMLVFPC